MVVGSPGAQISDSESFFFLNRYLNQSRNRESGKEGEGVVLLSGVGDGTECIGGIPRFYAGWQWGVGEGSPYAILRYICHRRTQPHNQSP